jgi:FdhE protein
MPLKPTAGVDPLVAQLRALAHTNPDLQPLAALYEIILPCLRDADLGAQPVELTREQAQSKLAEGQALLDGVELTFDHAAARELLIGITRGVENTKTIKAKAAHDIRVALEGDRLDSEVLFALVASGGDRDLLALAQDQRLDGDLLWTLAQQSFKPAFRAWQRQLAPYYDAEWEKGYCFVCGAGATLAELQGNDQEKHLRCGRCGADWMFRRLACLYCQNDHPKLLGYFQVDGKGGNARVETCENCKGYLKVINAFSPNALEAIIIQDLATLPLDYIAQQRGYERVAFQ